MRALPIIKWFLVGLGIAGIVGLAVVGIRGGKLTVPPVEIFPDMDRQPKFKTQAPSPFFADGRADRLPAEGTVPFGVGAHDPYFNTGKMGDRWGDGIPLKVDRSVIARGEERFGINCRPCHGALADGKGVVQQYNFNIIADLHQQRIREMADGEIFNTIGHGKNQMGPYPHITASDRWSIIAYLRVLQRARNATIADVPAAERAKLEAQKQEQPAAAATNAPPQGAAPPATNAPPAGPTTNAPAPQPGAPTPPQGAPPTTNAAPAPAPAQTPAKS